MTRQVPPPQAPAQMAQHFLHLLDDVHHSQGLFLAEIAALRARIQELEARHSDIPSFSSLSDIKGCAVYLETREGLIHSWSAGAQEMYGYSMEEMIGKPTAMLFPELRPASAIMNLYGPTPAERIRKDGRSFLVIFHSTEIQDMHRRTIGRLWLEIETDRKQDNSQADGLP